MFKPLRDDPQLIEAISKAFKHLETLDPDKDEYVVTVKQIMKLNAMKKKRVDPNTLLIVTGNFVIGVAVLKHEVTNVVTTKLWSFLTKTGTPT